MKVTGIYIYPVKGLGGISLPSSKLLTTGLEYDRQWMLVDHKGLFVTQRQLPRLASIGCNLSDTHLTLTHQGDSISLPLAHVEEQHHVAKSSTPVQVWNSQLTALDEGHVISDWLTSKLGLFRGKPLKLVRFDPRQTRQVSTKYQKQGETLQHYFFADGFPYLICSEQSLIYLNQHLAQIGESPVPMDRFRPNIVFDEIHAPFTELGQIDLKAEHTQAYFSLRKPCERCPVTTVNQHTGTRDNPLEPLKTLTNINPLDLPGAYFGGNAVLISEKETEIKLNDVWKLA